MRLSGSRVRRIIREEARRVLREDVLDTAKKVGKAYKKSILPGAQVQAAGGTLAYAGLAAPEIAATTGGVVGKLAAVGTATGAATGAAVLGAALAGFGAGTIINKGLNKAGVNDAVINWILAQRVSKVGLDFEVKLDPTVLAGNLDKATGKLTAAGAAGSLRPMSFTLTGVKGILIDPNTNAVINNNSFHGFGNASAQVPVNGTVKLRMPKKPEGIFVPVQLIGQVVYEGGAVVNLVSKEGTIVTQPGTSVVRGTLISNKKLGA